MSTSHIIRIPRTDTGEEDAFILGEVSPSGSKPLNLKFVATEGEEPYVVKLRQDRVSELRVSNSPCSPDEWETILKSVLLRNEPVEDIEAGAETQVGKAIIITIRRRVAGINQRLGTITLNHKADEGIQLFDWCGAAALGREKLRADLVAETAKVEDLEARVTELRNQLDELTRAKKAREDEMLEKFCVLLNEKKIKIREQQRLLTTAKVDTSKLSAVRAARQSSSPARAPKASRTSKRKAQQEVSSDDESDGFEKMDVDIKNEPPPSSLPKENPNESDSDEERQTPGADDTETGSEPEEDEEEQESLPTRRRKLAAEKGKSRSTASPPRRRAAAKADEALTMHPKRTAAKPSSSSPPSKAPATRHRSAAPVPAPAPAEGSETESDDEL